MLDQAAGLRLVQVWLGTGAELTHQDGYGPPLARVDDLEDAVGGPAPAPQHWRTAHALG